MSGRSILLFILLAANLSAQNKTFFISFNELSKFAEDNSPHINIINAERQEVQIKSELSLQWDNPEIFYEYENVKNNNLEVSEFAAYLGKTFSFPWNYWRLGSAWEQELLAADYRRSERKVQFIAALRSQYVKINLLHDLTERQETLGQLLDNLRQILTARQEEGAISQADETLVTFGIFGVQSDLLQTKRELRDEMTRFKQNLGLDIKDVVQLTTPITFQPLRTDSLKNINFIQYHPGIKSRNLHLAALDQQVSLEKSRIFPSFTLQGGYKKINPDFEGYVFGISLPLPILNWNRARVEEVTVQHQLKSVQTELYQQQLLSDYENLIRSIDDISTLIRNISEHNKDRSFLENLENAYREGSLSLTEFLNAIQLFRTGNRDFTQQLINYYRYAFQLEAISGRQLINFQ